MPSNKTLLVWIVATNLFWAGCITATFYSVSKRDTQIAGLLGRADAQDDYDKLSQNANMTIFRIIAAKIQDQQDDIDQLQKTCGLKPKEKYQ